MSERRDFETWEVKPCATCGWPRRVRVSRFGTFVRDCKVCKLRAAWKTASYRAAKLKEQLDQEIIRQKQRGPAAEMASKVIPVHARDDGNYGIALCTGKGSDSIADDAKATCPRCIRKLKKLAAQEATSQAVEGVDKG